MATSKIPAPDLVTLASLHAALDSILEIEALVDQITLPLRALTPARKLRALIAETRQLLRALLLSPPT